MANRLKKMIAQLLKEECNKAFKRGFEEGKQAGWDKRVLSYENEVEFLKTVIKALEERSAPRFLFKDGEIIPLNYQEWIPVTKRLPEDYATVLAYDGSSVEPSLYSSKRGFWTYDQYESDYISGVTHWMPLPEPPKP